jgi:hypothetical protein
VCSVPDASAHAFLHTEGFTVLLSNLFLFFSLFRLSFPSFTLVIMLDISDDEWLTGIGVVGSFMEEVFGAVWRH